MRLLSLMLAGALACGCSTPVGRSIGRAGSLEIAAPINTAAPATATRTVSRSEIKLPAGSIVQATAPGTVTLTQPADLVSEVTRDELATATGHAPPSPAEVARGWGLRLWIGAGAALVLLGIGLFMRGHGKAGVIAFFAGPLVALTGHWVNSAAGIIIGAVLVAVALTLFAAWHLARAKGVEI